MKQWTAFDASNELIFLSLIPFTLNPVQIYITEYKEENLYFEVTAAEFKSEIYHLPTVWWH